MDPYYPDSGGSMQNSQSRTLFDILKLASAEITFSDGILVPKGQNKNQRLPINSTAYVNMERILRSMIPLMKMPRQMWSDPRTHNSWALRGGKLYEISHAGFRPTLPNSTTQCVPAMARICPAGTWSAFNQGGDCTSCAVVPGLIDPIEQQIAFVSQCSPGAGQRRRLLSTTSTKQIYVRFVIVVPYNYFFEFIDVWPTSSCEYIESIAKTVCDVVVKSDDPLRTMRTMREWTMAHAQRGWEILTQPFVYSQFAPTKQPPASASTAENTSIWLIVGCVLGCTALVKIIITIVCVILNKNATNPG